MQSHLRNEVLQWAIKHQIIDLIQIFNDEDINHPFLKVQALNVSYKSIQIIPSFFSYFIELQILDISHNHLTEIPQEVIRLSKLQYIDISWNRISDIPQFQECVIVKNRYCRG